MNSQNQFIIKSFFVGVFSTGFFIICFISLLVYIFKHANFNVMSYSPGPKATSSENILALISLIGIVSSLFICPIYSIFYQQNIFQLTENQNLKVIIFCLFFGLQIIMLTITYCSVDLFSQYSRYKNNQEYAEQRKSFNELVQKLDDANVDVVVKKAKILSDDGKYAKTEITLQIKNVPNILPYYEMNIHEIGNRDDNLFFGGYDDKERKVNGVIRVINENGKWVFKEHHPNQIVSANEDEVVLRCGFFRKNATPEMLPQTITPRLGIWKRDDNVYTDTYQFYYKQIPISFEK